MDIIVDVMYQYGNATLLKNLPIKDWDKQVTGVRVKYHRLFICYKDEQDNETELCLDLDEILDVGDQKHPSDTIIAIVGDEMKDEKSDNVIRNYLSNPNKFTRI